MEVFNSKESSLIRQGSTLLLHWGPEHLVIRSIVFFFCPQISYYCFSHCQVHYAKVIILGQSCCQNSVFCVSEMSL